MKNRNNCKLLTNKKGQFTIVAAILVAIVLVCAVMTAYSAIQYNQLTSNPQTQSAIDEINLSLKNILGFTVGYYGSILQVTGNTSYANELAYNYVSSGLENTADLNPDWGPSFNVTNLALTTNWFTNTSCSSGNFTINYDLTGLGVYGLTYSASSQLDVNVLQSPNPNQVCISVTKDGTEPLTSLGLTSFKFYKYAYSNSTWEFEYPNGEPTSYANGTYLLNIPSDLDPTAYIISVEDNRGIMVVASSFSRYTSTLTWNSSSVNNGFYYVDSASPTTGTDSNFTAQQSTANSYDTLTENLTGTSTLQYFPTNWNTLGSTNYISGNLQSLQSIDGNCMVLQSYPSAYSSSYATIGVDSNSSAAISSGTLLSWAHTTTATGSNVILLVSVDVYNSGTPATVVSGGVTYGGTALTQVATALYSSSNPEIRSYVFMLVNPASGTKTISVSLSGSTTAIGGAVTYTNVNQTNPVLVNNAVAGSGSSQSVSLTASGLNTKMLYGHVATDTTNSYTLSDVAGQTNRWSQNSKLYKAEASDKSVTSGSVSTSWTTSRSTHWTAIAVLLQPMQVASAYTCSAVFSGTANTYNWNQLVWSLNSAGSTNGINITYQLYNYQTTQYATPGNDGYLSGTIGTTGITQNQTITSSPTSFRSSSGNWQLQVTATLASSTQFNLLIDMINYSLNVNNYDLNTQEQWNNVNATNPRQDLCIETGNLASESLMVDVFYGNSWINLLTLSPNSWNNVSLSSYITSSILLIRFRNGNNIINPIQSSWNIGAVLLKNEPDISFLAGLQDSTFSLEILQNGTMVWLGQQLQASTTGMPIPPIAVKAIHVNMTIKGVNQEVPFQVEDWASNYQVPLGLTNNATVFSNSQMIVLLLNKNVTDFTIWWNGSDQAVQTSYAYTSTYFANDNPAGSTLSNGEITLTLGSLGVTSTVVNTSTSSTASFMRINQDAGINGAGSPSYVIFHGVVRDIIQEEAEWSGGVPNCPNVYSNIVITLPANVTYYTYQLRLMFINSSEPRTITDLCPISLTTSVSTQVQTENGTLNGFPNVQNGIGTFYNSTSGSWTAHHWSQLISSDGTQGTGIMFTDSANQNLYTFNSIANGDTGALNATSTSLIELLPVRSTGASASFQYPLDITWNGAVATFNNSTPICTLQGGTTPSGLWILVEYPPTITQTAES